jgi:hypothetical protein
MLTVIIVIRRAGAINIHRDWNFELLNRKQMRYNKLGDERTP